MLERLRRYLGNCVVSGDPYVGAGAFPADLNAHLTDLRLPCRAHEKFNLLLGNPARKHHSLLNTQCFGECTPHQCSLSRLREIVPEENHLYHALQAQTSPEIQTYRDAPFPARQTPREHQNTGVRIQVGRKSASSHIREQHTIPMAYSAQGI